MIEINKDNTIFIAALPDETGNSNSIIGLPIIYSGAGKINSAIATCKAINLGYENIINIGSCGSLVLGVGEVVKIGKTYQDIDFKSLAKYGHTIFEENSHFIELDPNSKFSCFTTDYFFESTRIEEYSPDYLRSIKENSVFDMECFSIAKTCNHFGVKFTSYKWVSDSGDHKSWKDNCKQGFDNVKNIIINEYEEKRL